MTNTTQNKLAPINHSGYCVVKEKEIVGPVYQNYPVAKRKSTGGIVSTMKAAILHKFKGFDDPYRDWDYSYHNGAADPIIQEL